MTHRLVFLDTETTGLAHDADVWDFAAIVRADGSDTEHQFFVRHDMRKAERLPEPFLADYCARFDLTAAYPREDAAKWVLDLTRGATIVGAVPDFDTVRLRRLIVGALGVEPEWHYHLIDVENLAAGSLHGRAADYERRGLTGTARRLRDVARPPYDSETLSLAVGVDPEAFARHTALGDARWVRAIYDAVTRP